MSNTADLRRRIRAIRSQLPQTIRTAHAASACRLAVNHPVVIDAERVAIYLANDGELDPQPLLESLWSNNKRVHLPVINPDGTKSLWFAEYRAGDRLIPNRFGIEEPDIKQRAPVEPRSLDAVIVPLVLFDTRGNRVGMGGGYFDRTFSYRHDETHTSGPTLIGYAHELQRDDNLQTNSWDVALDYVITEKQIYACLINRD